MATDSNDQSVFLLGTIRLLYAHLTEALCQEAFVEVRERERQREWSLYAMAKFWAQVVLRAPQSLTQALQECAQGTNGYPEVDASTVAFFEKAGALRPGFFAAIFQRFLVSILPHAKPVYAQEFAHLDDRFTEVWALDGSRLAAIWRRLKKLWRVPQVVLPGVMLAFYDLRRGIIRHLHYSMDAAKSESRRAVEAIQQVPRGALLVGDRLFAVMKIFAAVTQQGAWLLAKRNKTVKFRHKRKLSSGSHDGGRWTAYEVKVGGTSKHTPEQTWRYIKWTRGRTSYELVTNILDPQMLSAAEAIALYRERWAIERLFYDLKEVLNLNRIYASNPYTVAQQVYACALVHTAMRIAQGQVASDLDLAPERISVEKFFPRLAAASINYLHVMIALDKVVALNPEQELILPDIDKMDFASVPLDTLLVEKRNDRRRKKKFSPERRKWTSYKSVPGMKKKILQN